MTGHLPVGAVCPYAGQIDDHDGGRNAVGNLSACTPSRDYLGQMADSPVNDIEKEGWMLCDGRALSVDAYPALFAVLGTLYGEGDTATARTFRIPDYRNLVMRGTDADSWVGPNDSGAGSCPTHIDLNYIIKFR